MVATISALSHASQAASYYEADVEYYAEGGLAPSAWQGAGARALDLTGEVDPQAFRALLEGKLPHGQQLGTMKEGVVQHRPGWDITMSAPKSVSIMAQVAGDRRLIEAHDRAVTSALAYAEQHCAATRIKESGGIDRSHVRREQTNAFTIASFRHETSRAQDPQLYTHNIIMNITRDAQGQWRSLEPRALYQLQKNIGAIYRQELAAEVKALGYAIETGKDSLFEIQGVPASVIKSFSERAIQIERGKSRASASAQEKQIASLDTRVAKENIAHSELITQWRLHADAQGFGMEQRLGLVAQAEQALAQPEYALIQEGMGILRCTQALRYAMETLAERQSVFSAAELEAHIGRAGLGHISRAKQFATLYTDSRAKLTTALHERKGERQVALDWGAGENQYEPIMALMQAPRLEAGLE
jgi:conjugative relaxase-like TrwC/TraI family protein